MERLYIIRHAVAVDHGTPGYRDEDRPLTPEGVEKFRKAARGLERLGFEVDKVVTSPLPRARRTAEILVHALGRPELLEAAQALAAGRSAVEVRAWLEHRPEARLAIVGHDPWCSELVGLLVTGHTDPLLTEMRKGGVAALTAKSGGAWWLDWLATPRILRRMR